MTDAYRQEQLETARRESAAARDRYNTAKTKGAKRDAAEDLEFWSNKVAFLTHAK
jgi:hypothetical protein